MASKLQIIIEAVDQASAPIRKLKGQFDSLANSIKGMTDIGTAGKMAWGAVKQVGEFADAIMKGIEQMQTMRSMLKASVTDQRDLGLATSWLSQEANMLGIEIDTLTKAYAGFSASTLRSGLSTKQTQQIFEDVGVASRSLGLSKERIDLVYLALQQMASKGKVSSEELRRQLAESLPGAFEIAAKSMGVTTVELNKMLQSGEVISKDFLPKFAATLRKEMGGSFADTANSVQANSARIETAFKNLNRAALDNLEPTVNWLQRALLYYMQIAEYEVKRAQGRSPERETELGNAISEGRLNTGYDERTGQYKRGLHTIKVELLNQKKIFEDILSPGNRWKSDYDDLETASNQVAYYNKELEKVYSAVRNINAERKKAAEAVLFKRPSSAGDPEKEIKRLERQEKAQKEAAAAAKQAAAAAKQAAKEKYDAAMLSAQVELENLRIQKLAFTPTGPSSTGLDLFGGQAVTAPFSQESIAQTIMGQGTPSTGIEQALDVTSAALKKQKTEVDAAKESWDSLFEIQTITAKASLDATVGNFKTMAEQWGAFGAAYKAFAIAQAVIDTYVSAGAIFRGFSGIPGVGHILGAIGAAAAIGAGMARVAQIKAQKFAMGGDFMTSGPQMIMVGDNPGGRERVRVDPVSSQNINGSGSSGGPNIEINIHNVTDTLIDALARSIRAGSASKLIRELKYAGAV